MGSLWSHLKTCGAMVVLVGLAACRDDPATAPGAETARRAPPTVQCDPGNGGITVPPGFCAVVVADLTSGGAAARARHMAVTPNGDLFVAINSPGNNQPGFGIIGLRDEDGDGRADEQTGFSPGLGGSGIAWGNGLLYSISDDRGGRIWRVVFRGT